MHNLLNYHNTIHIHWTRKERGQGMCNTIVSATWRSIICITSTNTCFNVEPVIASIKSQDLDTISLLKSNNSVNPPYILVNTLSMFQVKISHYINNFSHTTFLHTENISHNMCHTKHHFILIFSNRNIHAIKE